jgi:hypothetical protein
VRRSRGFAPEVGRSFDRRTWPGWALKRIAIHLKRIPKSAVSGCDRNTCSVACGLEDRLPLRRGQALNARCRTPRPASLFLKKRRLRNPGRQHAGTKIRQSRDTSRAETTRCQHQTRRQDQSGAGLNLRRPDRGRTSCTSCARSRCPCRRRSDQPRPRSVCRPRLCLRRCTPASRYKPDKRSWH